MYLLDLGCPIIVLIFYFTFFVLGMSNGRYGMFRESAVGSTRPKGSIEKMYIYFIFLAVILITVNYLCGISACKWTSIKWSKCNKSCGQGRRTGIRTQTGGSGCTLKRNYRGSCQVKKCPRTGKLQLGFLFLHFCNYNVNRQYLISQKNQNSYDGFIACKWSSIRWGTCSKSCGGGRRRGIRRQKGGSHCRRRASYRGNCNKQKCPTKNPTTKPPKRPTKPGNLLLD